MGVEVLLDPPEAETLAVLAGASLAAVADVLDEPPLPLPPLLFLLAEDDDDRGALKQCIETLKLQV